jgi:hypothetical protein
VILVTFWVLGCGKVRLERLVNQEAFPTRAYLRRARARVKWGDLAFV